jgi:transposase
MGEKWIYVGLDLGERVWVAGVLDLRSCEYHSRKFESASVWGDCVRWLVELGQDSGCRVHVLYEAGRQGFELARELCGVGVDVDIVAVSRLDKGKRKKRGKSDRMDAKALTYMDWTQKGFPSVWVPSREQEGMRNLLMWEDCLKRSVGQCRNRGLSILARWGVVYSRRMSLDRYGALVEGVEAGKIGDEDRLRLGSLLREEGFLREELEQAENVIGSRIGSDSAIEKLMVWRGIGDKTARVLAWYVGDWERFPNGRSFSAYCGLTPVHVRSGSSDYDLGVSRAGHRLLRGILGQLVLLFLRWQPECELVKQTQKRITGGKAGKIARTALARQLAAALWRWMVYDEEIPGAYRKV